MKKYIHTFSTQFLILGVLFILAGALIGFFWFYKENKPIQPSASENEPGTEMIEDDESALHPRLRGLENWKRPQGPWRVALQVGHLKADEAPEELKNLRVNTGTSYYKTTEWEVSLAIAEKTKKLLEDSGIVVEILPTTIPPNYWADIFISIHADGNYNHSISGYKVAPARLDHTGKAEEFAALLDAEYKHATKLPFDDNITKTMRGYYAFNWQRYDHSIHPMTIAAIIELGFLTNANDRRIIVNDPDKPARGIADGVLAYFNMPTKETAEIYSSTKRTEK